MNLDHVEAWIDGYVLAWASNDAEQIGALFTDNIHLTAPGRKPWSGREAIVREWLNRKPGATGSSDTSRSRSRATSRSFAAEHDVVPTQLRQPVGDQARSRRPVLELHGVVGPSRMTEQTMFALTPAQRDLAEMARRLAALTFQVIADAGVPGRVNRPLVAALGASGLLGPIFDETWERSSSACLREAIAVECIEAETALAMQGLGGMTIQQAGRPEVSDRWVPAIANGEAVAAFALSEPEHGTDAGAIELAAAGDSDGGYRLSGVKTWISNAPDADVYACSHERRPTRARRASRRSSSPATARGSPASRSSCSRAIPSAGSTFDGVQVPASISWGSPTTGSAWRCARSTGSDRASARSRSAWRKLPSTTRARTPSGATRSGDRSASSRPSPTGWPRWRPERRPPGCWSTRPLRRTTAARRGVTKTSAMAKLFATETAQWVVDSAVQIEGAAGLVAGSPLERLYREVRAPRIYEGTSEIQREIIARELYRT